MSSSAVVRSIGTPRQLDRKAEPEEQITEAVVRDPVQLARALTRVARNVADLKRRFVPRRIDFEDWTVDATGTTAYRLEHGFGGRVRYSVVEWSGASAPNLRKDTASDDNTLVLTSTVAGTATIRVEEAG